MGLCSSKKKREQQQQQRSSNSQSSLQASSSSSSSRRSSSSVHHRKRRKQRQQEQEQEEQEEQANFLDKYSFAAINPTYAVFPDEIRDEIEATSALRALAKQSFDPSPSSSKSSPATATTATATAAADHAPRLRRVNSYRQGSKFVSEIEEIVEEEHLDDKTGFVAMRSQRRHRSKVTVVEENLVMSSRCLPEYSLGIVTIPECRAPRRL